MSAPTVQASVVLPLFNESESILQVVDEIADVLGGVPTLAGFEIIAVDDASTDTTVEILRAGVGSRPWLRVIALPRNQGQSRAFHTGFVAARGAFVITCDGDGQNDLAELPAMLARAEAEAADIVVGMRVARVESRGRRSFSRVANRLLNAAAGTNLRDTGCSLKVFRAEVLAQEFLRDDHRFLPALTQLRAASEGRALTIVEHPVGDRARMGGVSKYGYARIPRVAIDLAGIAALRYAGDRPLRQAARIGTGMALAGLIPGRIGTLTRALGGAAVIGWSSALIEQQRRTRPRDRSGPLPYGAQEL